MQKKERDSPADLKKMKGGHEIWLESHALHGGNLQIRLLYGDLMRSEGILDPAMVTPTIVSPDGTRTCPIPIRGDDALLFCLPSEEPGYYTTFVDLQPVIISVLKDHGCRTGPKRQFNDVMHAASYRQMAKLITAHGEAGTFRPSHIQGTFDMLPDMANPIAGNTVILTLLYKGQPVPDTCVCAISREEGRKVCSGHTDKKGSVSLLIPCPGVFMFIAWYRDRTKKSPDEFDETVFVTTLVLETTHAAG